MQDGSFYTNEIFLHMIEHVKNRHSSLHLIGLFKVKKVHTDPIDYPWALLRMAKTRHVDDVYIHVLFDGRSSGTGSAPTILIKFERGNQRNRYRKNCYWHRLALDRDGKLQEDPMWRNER